MRRDLHTLTPEAAAAFEAAHAPDLSDPPETITPDDVAPTTGDGDCGWWLAFVGRAS